MATLLRVGLLLVSATVVSAASECCPTSDESDFCLVFNMLSPMEQGEVMTYLGEHCDGDAEGALKKMEKRKPNFMRYGRSGGLQFGKKGSDPNFLRFGRSQPNFLRFGRSAGDPNFLRFGRRDPNFLRFGKAAADPNFLRFGKRSSEFDRETRKPNFLRFGK